MHWKILITKQPCPKKPLTNSCCLGSSPSCLFAYLLFIKSVSNYGFSSSKEWPYARANQMLLQNTLVTRGRGGGGPGYLFLFLGTSMGSFSKQWLVIKNKNTLAMNCMGGRCSRLMVSVLDSGLGSPGLSPGRGHCVIFGQDTLLSPCLSPPRSIYVQD